jgi:hypothetical protein
MASALYGCAGTCNKYYYYYYYCRFAQLKEDIHFSSNETYNPENHANPKLNTIWTIFENKEKKSVELHSPERSAIDH